MAVSDGKVLKAIAETLIDARDEPWPGGSDTIRLHYWRDKAINAAVNLHVIAALSDDTWQPIDTMPKVPDIPFLLWDQYLEAPDIGGWDAEMEEPWREKNLSFKRNITHWKSISRPTK